MARTMSGAQPSSWIRSAIERAASPRSSQRMSSTSATAWSLSYPSAIVARMDVARRIAVARGDEPADTVVRGGRVLSVFTREWLEVDVAIVDGFVAGLGSYEGRETIDAAGRWVVP